MAHTRQHVLEESTRVAQAAAATIGGTFEEGRFSPETGEVLGGFEPSKVESADIEPQSEQPFIEATTAQITPTEERVESELEALREEVTNLRGESAFRTQQEKDRGLPGLEATQRDLNAQLNALNRERQAVNLGVTPLATKAKEMGVSTAGITALGRDALRENAIKTLAVTASLEATQGNIATARDAVDRAVSTKFDPIREEIEILETNLNLLMKSPTLDAEERKRAEEQKEFQAEKKKQLEELETTQKRIWDISVDAAEAGADPITIRSIQQAETEEEALGLAAPYLSSPKEITQSAQIIAEQLLQQMTPEDAKRVAAFGKVETEDGKTITFSAKEQEDIIRAINSSAKTEPEAPSPTEEISLGQRESALNWLKENSDNLIEDTKQFNSNPKFRAWVIQRAIEPEEEESGGFVGGFIGNLFK